LARVLFICPAAPAPDRSGLAMRAGVSVEGLDRHYDLTVAVVRSASDTPELGWVRRHSQSVVDAPYDADRRGAMSWFRSQRGRRLARHPLPTLARFRPPAVGDRIIDEAGCDFDIVVVMGTYLAGVALPLLEAGVPGVLDAFDDDARTCASLARLDPSYADEVPRYEAFQPEVFSWFERILFAAPQDAVPPFGHLPNAVRIPPRWSTTPTTEPLDLLFVGNPGYRPNRDALDRLRNGIVPALADFGIEVRLSHPGTKEDVGPFYRRAHVAAVPLRAAGGTRIKILEAFAHGCPVVSTPTGARGLEVMSGEQLLITADDDDDVAFAELVANLLRDEPQRAAIAEAARAHVVAHHDHVRVGERLAMLVGELVASPRATEV
jgi:polysaccharide biosynthesis protein PslH